MLLFVQSISEMCTKPSVLVSSSAKKPYSAMLETFALWIEFIGKESLMSSQGSLVNCFKPREILDFSLSKLVTLKSSLSPTFKTSDG